MRRSIEIAPLFDASIVRLFSFWKEDEMTDEKWERVFEKLELPIRIAEAEGVTIGFENVSSGNIGTSQDLERLFGHFDSPALKLIWDPGNALAAGDDRSAADGYAAVRDHVVNVHVKDAGFIDGKRHWLPIGAGDVDYLELFLALAEDEYDGVVALETHYRPESGSRIEGSRESLEGLRAVIAEATS
jgi:sugar phosphate isomerase/epimerase